MRRRAAGETHFQNKPPTRYPWDDAFKLRVTPAKSGQFTLCLRIHGWVEGRPLPSDLYTYDDATPAKWTVRVNGKEVPFNDSRRSGRESAPSEPGSSESRLTSAATNQEIKNGFAQITRDWKSGDEVTLDLPMPVRRVAGNPKIAATRNQVALERGPIVYALEALDNDGSVFDVVLPTPVRTATVSWFDDTGTGECRLPAAWRILHRDNDGQWQPVTNASGYTIQKRDPVKITFDTITTKALRLEIQLPKDFSAGLYEWEVE